MKRISKTLICITIMCFGNYAGADVDPRAADARMYPADVRFNAAIPTPESILGFQLGAEPVRHHQLVDYITRIAALSDRMSAEVIGYSHERRPILFVTVTTPDNHARLDQIKVEHASLTEPGTPQPTTTDMPVISWVNFGVHGAESSGMDASLPFLYFLAAAEGDEIERILSNSVILVTAIFNPDGHSKRIAWFDAYGGDRDIADPAHIEHQFNWQFARTNHYWFDLNRQWLLLTQPEARAWMKKWHEWRPNLTVDYHEMGGSQTYYFHPGAVTRTNPLVRDDAEKLLAATVKRSEEALDREARLYFHGERFDNYYVGKGSTFPLINGGIGVLYEAGAALGREIETPNGLRTYRENIRKHFRTAIASIESAVALRPDFLRHQQQFYQRSVDDATRHPTKAWVFASPGDPVRLQLFADLLNFHRIATHRLSSDIAIDGQTFVAADSLIVPMAQHQHLLIRSIFETVTEFEDATFYDVSTWTMPPAFGLSYAALSGRNFRQSHIGERAMPVVATTAMPQESEYGYLFEWGPYYAPRALQRVLESELMAKVATKDFSGVTTDGSKVFPPGSILIPFDRQEKSRQEIYELMRTISSEDHVTVHALVSGKSATGTLGIDAGGPSFRALKEPKVLLAVGDKQNLYDAGEIWHLLDFRMNLPVTLRHRDTLDGIDWARYTHIVFPSGDYEDYAPDYLDRLRLWVKEGGSVIGMRLAAPWVRSNTIDWVDPQDDALATVNADDETAPVTEESDEVQRKNYSDLERHEVIDKIGGAIFAVDLDNTHPLGFGYPTRKLYLHKNVEEPLLPTDNPFATVIAYSSDPVYSGYVSDKNRDALANTPALIAERSGDGSVILFADNPNFRGYWYGTNKLFMNALFFSTIFDAPKDE